MGKVVNVIQVSTSSFKEGTVEVKDEEKVLQNFKDAEMSDVGMNYYREPMRGNGIFHDFLLVHGRSGDSDSELGDVKLYITAEKTYVTGEHAKGNEVETCKEREDCFAGKGKVKRQLRETCGRGQINISITQVQPDCSRWERHLEPVKFKDCGKITLNELVDVLKDHPKRYFLLKGNCWRYASYTFKNVIKKFINHQDTSKEARERLNEVLAELEPKFPTLPSSYFKPVLIIGYVLTGAIFLVLVAVQFFVIYPEDLAVGNCVMAVIDGLSQQATPRGLRVPLVCAKTRSWKLVYRALKILRQSWLGRIFLTNPSLVGKLVRILSSKVLLPAVTTAVIFSLLIAIGYFGNKCWKIYLDNHAGSWKDERESNFAGHVGDIDTML